MKKRFFTAVLLAAMLMTACGGNAADSSEAEISAAESEITTISETSAETDDTTEITTEKTEAETEETTESAESETETQPSETTEAETAAETEAVSETMSAEELAAIMELIEANSKTVGNDTAGYITVYSGSGYEEDEYGDFTVTSEDGAERIDVMFYDNLQTNLDQTAYMFCLTAVMNAEIDGFEVYNITEVTVDGMEGYFGVMIDDDEGTGFRLYAAFADKDSEMVRVLRCESSDYTSENVIVASVVFDSYRRTNTDS